MNDESKPLVIEPRTRPRTLADFCVCAFMVAPIQLAVLFGIPAGIAFSLTHSMEFAVAVMALVFVLFFLFTVSRLSLSAEGIRFHRILGFPKFLPWEQVTSVEPAPQRELIVRGWLWPLFPAREMTASFSSLQHFRIAWDRDCCYFPPADCDLFQQYVSTQLKSREV